MAFDGTATYPHWHYQVIWEDGRPVLDSFEVVGYQNGWCTIRRTKNGETVEEKRRPRYFRNACTSPAEAWGRAIVDVAECLDSKVCNTDELNLVIRSALAHAYWSGGGDGKRQTGAEYLGAHFEELPEEKELP